MYPTPNIPWTQDPATLVLCALTIFIVFKIGAAISNKNKILNKKIEEETVEFDKAFKILTDKVNLIDETTQILEDLTIKTVQNFEQNQKNMEQITTIIETIESLSDKLPPI